MGKKDFVLIFLEKYLRFQETCLSNIGKLSFKLFLLPVSTIQGSAVGMKVVRESVNTTVQKQKDGWQMIRLLHAHY